MSDSFTLTCLLAAAALGLRAAALWLTRFPVITVFHVVLATGAITFGIRPLLCAAADGYVLYGRGIDWWHYNAGLAYQLLFDLLFIAGYLLWFRRGSVRRRPVAIIASRSAVYVAMGVGLSTLAVMHVLSEGAWLPTQRTQAVTTLMPGGPVLFRLAAVTLSASLPLLAALYLAGRIRSKLWPAALALIALISLTLLYQRGLVLVGLETTAWLIARARKVSYRSGLALALVFIAGIGLLRPFARVLSSWAVSSETERWSPSTSTSLMEKALDYTDSFCLADVWLVSGAYVEQNGHLGGRGLLAVPALLTPASFRRELGVATANETLNRYYLGNDNYESMQYGFTVNLAQSLFVDGGLILFSIALIPGILTASLDRWLYRVNTIGPNTIFFATAAFVTGGFIANMGILSYGLAYVLVGQFLWIFLRLWKAPQPNVIACRRLRSAMPGSHSEASC